MFYLFPCLILQENSLKEWSYKSAITIETYDGYDPIPVPFNIIYSVAKRLKLVKKKREEKVNGAGAVVRALASTNATLPQF